ncbi:hypothetical protein J1N35_041294, partial [Gossypium stocksii]
FTLDVSDNYVKKALGKNWRDHKSALKKEYFNKSISLEEKLRNVQPEMLRYQWKDAVRFWNSKKGEDRERVRTTSRQKQKFMHTAGSKSFACVADDKKLSSSQKVTRLQLFDITQRKKDGSLMTTEAAKITAFITELLLKFWVLKGMVGFDFKESGTQASTIEKIAQLKMGAASRDAEAQRKYDEIQLQLKAEAATREVKSTEEIYLCEVDAIRKTWQNGAMGESLRGYKGAWMCMECN